MRFVVVSGTLVGVGGAWGAFLEWGLGLGKERRRVQASAAACCDTGPTVCQPLYWVCRELAGPTVCQAISQPYHQ